MSHKKDETALRDIGIILAIFLLLFLLLVPIGCNGGWVIAGWEVTPSDSSHHIFVSLFDQDSTQHSYKRPVHLDGDNWCYKHDIWEVVRKND